MAALRRMLCAGGLALLPALGAGCAATTAPATDGAEGVPATALHAAGVPADAARISPSLPLQVGEPLEVDVAAEGRVEIALPLPEPSFLHLRLEQRGIDATLTLEAADGTVVATSRGEAGRWEEEVLVAVATAPGRYLLRATPVAEEEGVGRLAVELIELRGLRPEADPRRLELERLYADTLEAVDPARRVAGLRKVATGLGEIGAEDRRAAALTDLARAVHAADPTEVAAYERAYDDAVEAWGRLGDLGSQAYTLDDRARRALAVGRFDDARRDLDRAAELAAASGEPGPMAMVANTRGALAHADGEPARALEQFAVAAEHYQRAGDLRNYANALLSMGMLERRQGVGEASPEAMAGCLKVEEAMRLVRELRYERSAHFINYGLCQRSRGRGDAAYAAYTEAVELARERDDQRSHGLALFHLGSLLAELGDYERGRRLLEEARELLSSRPTQVDAEVYLGWIEMLEGRPEAGIERFRQAVEREPDHGAAWLGWGEALLRLDRPAEALEPLGRALDLARAGGLKRSQAEALRKLGGAHLALGDLATARSALGGALAVGPAEASVEGATRSQLARLLAAEGRPEEALAELRRAMRIREETRSTISHPEVRATYLSRWREDFSLLIDLLLRTGAPDVEVWEASERAHARTLQELLVAELRDERGEPPSALVERRRGAEAQESLLISRLFSGDLGADEERAVRAELAELDDELESLEWQVRQATDGAGPADAVRPRSLAEIQALLEPRQALLEYAMGEERSFLFVVTADGLVVHADLPPADVIAADVDEMRTHLEVYRPHLLRRLHQVAGRLYAALLAPAEGELEEVDSLVVVPDRELFYLPFEALLRDGESSADGSPAYVIDRWQVGYVPAATVLAQLREQTRGTTTGGAARNTLVAFADSRAARGGAAATRDGYGGYGPLPASRVEVREIAELLPLEAATLYIGEAASKARLDDPAVLQAIWLHFAVHGFFDDRRPDISGLMLSDGELRASEIRQLDLAAQLVVLSACQTGLGREVWGEELIGLSRAFFAAGAPTVVVSLWRVADQSTATLMVELYRGLLDGLGPMQALTHAKRQLRDRHPYYWAPFIVIGEPDFAAPPGAAAEAPRNVSQHRPPVSGEAHPSPI